jgi:hypothetical protein
MRSSMIMGIKTCAIKEKIESRFPVYHFDPAPPEGAFVGSRRENR